VDFSPGGSKSGQDVQITDNQSENVLLPSKTTHTGINLGRRR